MVKQKRGSSARWFSAVINVKDTRVLVLRYRTVFRSDWWIKFAGGKESASQDGTPRHTAFREGREELLTEGAITRLEEFYQSSEGVRDEHVKHFFLCDFRGVLRTGELRVSGGSE